MHKKVPYPLLSRWLIIVGLIEQEVCSELLVFVAGEVCLNGLIPVEAEAAELIVECQLPELEERRLICSKNKGRHVHVQ